MASEEFGIPILDLAAFDLDLVLQDVVSNELIEKHRVLPLFKRGNRLYVAQSDPSAVMAIDEIKFTTGKIGRASCRERAQTSFVSASCIRSRSARTFFSMNKTSNSA